MPRTPQDHEAAISLGELDVVLQGSIHRLIGLWSWQLGLALLAEGATDVAPNGGVVLEEVLCLPLMEQAGGFKLLLEVLRACGAPMGLRPSGTVGHGHHLHPMMLLVLVPLVTTMLG